MIRLWFVAMSAFFIPTLADAADRYLATFADGTSVEGAEIRDWNEPTSQAKIGDRVLFDAKSSVRWIAGREQPVRATPPMYVDFGGGDRLAGEVVSCASGLENPYDLKPRYLVMKSIAEVNPPDVVAPAELLVTTEWIQRVVWERVGTDELRPGTLWLRTGATMAFRSLRWTSMGVTVLTNEGIKQFLFSEMGEVHLPELDPWISYYEQLAVLSPACDSQLIQLCGNDGSRWTTSVKRFQPRSFGDRSRSDQWCQLIQPAWCLSPIWLRYRTIQNWRFFYPAEVPLSNFVPIIASHRAVFGQGMDWRKDQNVLGGGLKSLHQEFGWGIGVHGTTELVFRLPTTALSIRTKYGLDRVADEGGCVNVEVLTGDGQSLLKHLNLIGAETVGEMDWSDIQIERGGQRRVTFRTEMAHEGRPAGADPFDVRDLVNWYEPEIRLDRPALGGEVLTRAVSGFQKLTGWSVASDDLPAMKTESALDSSDPLDPHFRTVARSTDCFYRLSKTIKIGTDDRWLAIAATRFPEHSISTIQLRINGQVHGDFEVPVRQSMSEPDPLLIPLHSMQGRTVLVELVVFPTDEKSWVDFKGFSVSVNRPGLLPIFEDDEKFATLLDSGNGSVKIDLENPFAGTKCLRLTPGAGDNPMIPGLQALICEYPRLGQFRYLAFAWKKTTGTRIQFQLAESGRLGDVRAAISAPPSTARFPPLGRTQAADDRGRRFRYCYEAGVATTQPPTPLWMQGDLPQEWKLIQRDLFNDFGVFTVTGVSLNCVNGDEAWFDHIYLARSKHDLEYAAAQVSNQKAAASGVESNVSRDTVAREDYPIVFSETASVFSSPDPKWNLSRSAEFNGENNVLRTETTEPGAPFTVRAGVAVPNARRMELQLTLDYEGESDGQLVVRANGESLYNQAIEKTTSRPSVWTTVKVDLSRYSGQKVLIEVVIQPKADRTVTAIWKRIAIVEQ